MAVDAQRPVDVADELKMTLAAVYKAKAKVLRRIREVIRGLEEIE